MLQVRFFCSLREQPAIHRLLPGSVCSALVEKCCIDQIFSSSVHLTVDTSVLSLPLPQLSSLLALPVPSSPSLKSSPFPPPLQYPVLTLFSFFFSLFSAPQCPPPPLSHPPSTLQPPYVSPVTLSSSVRRSSTLPALAKWQKEAVGGLASCISHMHYSCALQSVWVLVFCWLFTGTHGPCERALCAGHRV